MDIDTTLDAGEIMSDCEAISAIDELIVGCFTTELRPKIFCSLCEQ